MPEKGSEPILDILTIFVGRRVLPAPQEVS